MRDRPVVTDQPGRSDGRSATIELGTVHRETWDSDPVGSEASTGPAARAGRLRRFRSGALVAAVVLVLAAGGAAAPEPPPLTEVATIGLSGLPEYVIGGDRLFVSSGRLGGSTERTISAHDLRDGRQLWDRPHPSVPDGGTDGAPVRDVLFRLVPADGMLLIIQTTVLADGAVVTTTGLDATTGEARWSLPHPVEAMAAGRLGLVTEENFPPGSLVRADDPQQAERKLYHGSDGRIYDAPPDGHRISVVDLATGRPRWTSPLIEHSALLDGAAPLLVLLPRTGPVEVRDAATGRVEHRIPVTGRDRPMVSVARGIVLVQLGQRVTAYAVGTWAPVWSRPLPDSASQLYGCDVLVCVHRDDQLVLIDPADGSELAGTASSPWTNDPSLLRLYGGYLVHHDDNHVLRHVVDPRTGREVLDLTRWQHLVPAPGGWPVPDDDRPALLMRAVDGQTWFGLFEPGAPLVRLLGAVPRHAMRCDPAAGRLIVCQTSFETVHVWRYR